MKKRIFLVFILFILIIGGILFNKLQSQNTINTNANSSIDEKEGMRITLVAGSTSKDFGNSNSNSYFIRTKNDKLIVVDGGLPMDADGLLEKIQKYGNGRVDYYFITHPHGDHVGALETILADENADFEIENLYYSFNDITWYEKYDKRGYQYEENIINQLSNSKIKNAVSCEKNQIIEMDNVECKILRIANPEITNSDNGNDSSMVFKMTAKDVNKSMLFLGDAYTYTTKELLENPEELSSYAVQMAHHGQNGVSKEVYDAIHPTIAFFNAPEWLYNNDSGEGYNTGNWKSIEVRSWLDEYGTTSILSFEGDQTIQLTKDGWKKISND